jgi:uncharacterized protein YuzE
MNRRFGGIGGIMPGLKIQVNLSRDEARVTYIALPGHRSRAGIVSKTIVLDAILDYTGPLVHLDLDKNGTLIGIEILV